jgi:hypothetical protein
MKAPVVLVAVALTVAILLAASLLIATGTRGDAADPAIGRQHTPAVVE